MARYRIDPKRSHVWIDARSNVHPIHTEADGLDGWLELDVRDGKINLDHCNHVTKGLGTKGGRGEILSAGELNGRKPVYAVASPHWRKQRRRPQDFFLAVC